jgi:hypothetical protein
MAAAACGQSSDPPELDHIIDHAAGVVDEGDPGAAVNSPDLYLPPDTCGNGTCEPANWEDSTSCPADCPARCGDALCQDAETSLTCPEDCMVEAPKPICGDGDCYQEECDDGVPGPTDEIECAVDCGVCYCGDRVCTSYIEDEFSCSLDCMDLFPQPIPDRPNQPFLPFETL